MNTDEFETAHLVLDWHPDLRTRNNLGLREYLKVLCIDDPRVLVYNIEGNDYYIIYSGHRMIYYGEYAFDNQYKEGKPLFEVKYSRNLGRVARFCLFQPYKTAWNYAMLQFEDFHPYELDDQPAGKAWEPNWGASVIHSDIEYPSSAEVIKVESGIICAYSRFDGNYESKELENGIFIPYDYSYPPAEYFVGCEVDGTFYLLYNHMTRDQVESAL